MRELFPILLILIFFSLRSFSAAGKKPRGKGAFPRQNTKDSGAKQPLSADTGMDQQLKQEFPHLYQQASLEDTPDSAAGMSHGSLTPSMSEGTDPCHDDLKAVPVGSLGSVSMEGMDPCHDDPYAMPTGSLNFDSMEGKDPCHEPQMISPPDEPEAASAAGSSLTFNWTGDEIVKGFLYGEIFRRKTD